MHRQNHIKIRKVSVITLTHKVIIDKTIKLQRQA